MSNNNFDCGDILHFIKYFFTDIGTSKPHFALVLLPAYAGEYEGSIYCCVITSQKPRADKKFKYHLELKSKEYAFFAKNSYACFDRREYQALTDLNRGRKQPMGKLNEADRKKGFRALKNVLYARKQIDRHLRGVLFREWKKLLGRIPSVNGFK